MLPIAEFNYMGDDELITVGQLIKAINSISFVKIGYGTIQILEREGLIKTKRPIEEEIEGENILNRFLGYPEEPFTVRISKANSLKVLEIVKAQEKQQAMQQVKKHSLEKRGRESKALPLAMACLDAYRSGTGGEPTTAEQLMSYCLKNTVPGYTDLQDTGGGKESQKNHVHRIKAGFNRMDSI